MPNPLPVPRFTARGSEPATGAGHRPALGFPVWLWYNAPVRRLGASCLPLSSRAVGEAQPAQAHREVRGGVLLSSGLCSGSVHISTTVPLNGQKTDTSGISVLYLFLSPFPSERGHGNRFAVPFLPKAQGKREQRKKAESPYFLHLRAQAGNVHPRFERHRQEWNWKWD